VLVKRRRHRTWMKLARPLRGWVPMYRTIAADDDAGADGDATAEARRKLRFQLARKDQAVGFTR